MYSNLCNPQNFPGPLSAIDGYGGQMVMVSKVPSMLQVECFPPWEYKVFISPMPESVVGIDILQGQTLPTSTGEFHLQFKVIKPVQRGNANWELVSLPLQGRVVTVKQYKSPGVRGNKVIGEIIQELP